MKMDDSGVHPFMETHICNIIYIYIHEGFHNHGGSWEYPNSWMVDFVENHNLEIDVNVSPILDIS